MRDLDPPQRFGEASGGRQQQAPAARVQQGVWCLDLHPPVSTQLPVAEQIRQWQACAQLVACNDAMAQMYGYASADAIIGRALGTVVPADEDAYRTFLHAFAASGYQLTGYEVEEQDRDRKAHRFVRSLMGTVVDGQLVRIWGSQIDITAWRVAEQARRDSEERWQRLMEQHPEPTLITRQDTIVYMNEAGAHLLGTDDASRLFGRSLFDFVPEAQHPHLQKCIAAVEQGETLLPQEYTVSTLDGDTRRVEMHSVPVSYLGQPAAQSVWRDVTARYEYELGLIEAKERAEEMDQLKTTFLMNISHEVRTPLTAILGFAEIIADEAEGEARIQAQLIGESGHRLMTTLSALLDLAEMEGKLMHLMPHRTDVVEQALRVLYVFKRKAQDRGLVLQLSVPRGHSVYAFVDQRALNRVLESLVSNAIKFTHQGSIELIIEVVADDLFIHVDDTGIGITPNFVEHSFEAFRQESQGIQRMYEGSGLGLTVARRFVELMGGTIDVKSEKGKGSRFTVYLPGVVLNSTTALS